MRILKKSDIYLVLFVVCLCSIIFMYKYAFSQKGGSVEIYVDNELYATELLDTDKDINIFKGNEICNTVSIRSGNVSVVNSNCPDGLCEKQQSISLNNESICCLPNRVLIIIKTDKKDKYDAIVQ